MSRISYSSISFLVFVSVFVFHSGFAKANAADEILGEDEIETASVPITPARPALAGKIPGSSWSFLLPSFVVHGTAPVGEAAAEMPRKLDSGGRSVLTPGFGFSYQGPSSLDVTFAVVKDCYDGWAGTIQVGQYFRWRETTKFGYTLGVYVRETPILCLTQTSSGGGGSGGIGGGLIGGGRGRPSQSNSFTSTTCGFADNLPLRYTTTFAGGYVDIIPTPFLNFSTGIYRGFVDVDLKIMTNFFLNEVGLSFPF